MKYLRNALVIGFGIVLVYMAWSVFMEIIGL